MMWKAEKSIASTLITRKCWINYKIITFLNLSENWDSQGNRLAWNPRKDRCLNADRTQTLQHAWQSMGRRDTSAIQEVKRIYLFFLKELSKVQVWASIRVQDPWESQTAGIHTTCKLFATDLCWSSKKEFGHIWKKQKPSHGCAGLD